MVSKILSGSIYGIDANIINVEADISSGLPSFSIVGLPDSAIKESKDRVNMAIKNSDIGFPIKKIIVNLAPANIKKEGPSFDLPIAISILVSMGLIPKEKVEGKFFTGELSLDGQISKVAGILSMVDKGKEEGIKTFIIPTENMAEALLIKDIEVIGVNNLKELVAYLKNNTPMENIITEEKEELEIKNILDYGDVSGQESVKRAIVIGAAGNHNIIMIGPPGSGKTMMAKRIPSILPSLTYKESVEVTKIYSVANMLSKNELIKERPFRSPHHTISYSALTGGGAKPKPGEVSLAHKGVLFLDELPEFYKNALEVLRQPMEDGEIHIARVRGNITYPSNFMLVASMNPCPCGYYGSGDKCTCNDNEINRYMNKISGPLLDRIDIQVEASAVDYKELNNNAKKTTSKEMKTKVLKAIEIQSKRYKDEIYNYNSDLTPSGIEKYCKLDDACQSFLASIFDSMGLSMRAYHKILKLARTIADIDNKENIEMSHIAEAVQYRNLDRKYF